MSATARARGMHLQETIRGGGTAGHAIARGEEADVVGESPMGNIYLAFMHLAPIPYRHLSSRQTNQLAAALQCVSNVAHDIMLNVMQPNSVQCTCKIM